MKIEMLTLAKKTPSGSGRGQGKANDGIWL